MGLGLLLEVSFLGCHCYLGPVVSAEVPTAKCTDISFNTVVRLLPQDTVKVDSCGLCTASGAEHLELLILQFDLVLLANLFHARVNEVVAWHVLWSHLVECLSCANVEVFWEANGSHWFNRVNAEGQSLRFFTGVARRHQARINQSYDCSGEDLLSRQCAIVEGHYWDSLIPIGIVRLLSNLKAFFVFGVFFGQMWLDSVHVILGEVAQL